jgi:uncharacterized membrane protein
MRKFFLYLLSVFYIIAGLNHFINIPFYIKMIPGYLPWPLFLVYLSGLAETALGILVLSRKFRKISCVIIILMLIAFMPVHIYLIQLAEKTGEIPLYIAWIRLPFQVLFVYWAWYFYKNPDISGYEKK